MAVKPYPEGTVWSFRLRLKGQAIYRTGFASAAKARAEAERLRQQIVGTGLPKHDGPWRTTLAQALQHYGRERLPALKGARQDANRINAYLRAAGLEILELRKPSAPAAGTYWEVSLAPGHLPRRIPNGLHAHRQRQAAASADSRRLMRELASMPVARIEPYHVQALIDTLLREGYEPATIGLERALLRQVFNYARKTWLWVEPARNPATHLTLPKIDNARDRVLTNAEWRKVSAELAKSQNPYAAPAIALLLETAMRVSEPLLQATWADVDWQRCVLHLNDAKAGARDVPLNPAAIDILTTLRSMRADDDADPRLLPISYEALKALWNRACAAAGVEDAHIHDLRHTAATRFTLQLNGNLPVLKIITGHKTYSQLNRYINVKPADVARLLHGRPLTEDDAPAGLHPKRAELAPAPVELDPADLPANVVPLRRREGVGAS